MDFGNEILSVTVRVCTYFLYLGIRDYFETRLLRFITSVDNSTRLFCFTYLLERERKSTAAIAGRVTFYLNQTQTLLNS